MLLVDTSVWVLTTGRRDDIDRLAQGEPYFVCPPVVQEVLRGSASTSRFRLAREMFRNVGVLDAPMPLERFEQAAELYMSCRDSGVTPRKGFDCLIAATALAFDATVLHRDSDFDEIARVTRLKARRI